MFYHIIKIGRVYNGLGYSGPTCEVAGVEPGQTYKNFHESLKDALLLSLYNPTGFNILQTKPGHDENGLEEFVVYATVKNGEVDFLRTTDGA